LLEHPHAGVPGGVRALLQQALVDESGDEIGGRSVTASEDAIDGVDSDGTGEDRQ